MFSQDTEAVLDFISKVGQTESKERELLGCILEAGVTINAPELVNDIIFWGKAVDSIVNSVTDALDAPTAEKIKNTELSKSVFRLHELIKNLSNQKNVPDFPALKSFDVDLNSELFERLINLSADLSILKNIQVTLKYN